MTRVRVSDSDDIFVDEFLAHYGVKGQKWGVRKKEDGSGDESSSEDKKLTDAEKKARAKKVAIGVGALLAVAGAGAVAYQLNKNGKLPISSIRKPSKSAAPAVKKVLQEPTSIIHTSRGKNKGFRFYQQGGTPDYFQLWSKHFEQAGGAAKNDMFEKLPNGMVAAAFPDPKGRKDAVGRVIPHEVIVPAYLTTGINTISDVVKHVWPMLEDAYNYDE